MHFSAWWYRRFPRLVFNLRRVSKANYEREMELLDVLCDPARTGIDVGAKVGMYTYRIRACSSDVIAFEPIPLFHDMLRAVFEGKRGHIEPVAASDQLTVAVRQSEIGVPVPVTVLRRGRQLDLRVTPTDQPGR